MRQPLVLTQLRANVEQMRTGAWEMMSGSEKALRLLGKAHGKQGLTLTGNRLLELCVDALDVIAAHAPNDPFAVLLKMSSPPRREKNDSPPIPSDLPWLWQNRDVPWRLEMG